MKNRENNFKKLKRNWNKIEKTKNLKNKSKFPFLKKSIK